MPTATKPPKIVRFKSKDGKPVEFAAKKTKQSKAAAARNGVTQTETTETATKPAAEKPAKKSGELGTGAALAIVGGALALTVAIGMAAWSWSKKTAPKASPQPSPEQNTALRVVA
jgi:hypothetical protein